MRLRDERCEDRVDAGSALIGLLVGILLVGLVAGVAVVVFSTTQTKTTPPAKDPSTSAGPPSTSPPDNPTSSACAADYQTIQTAEEAFFATTGSYATMAELVSAHLLTNASILYDVTTTGATYAIAARPSAGGECAVPPR